MQRSFDILFSTLALVFLILPLFILVVILRFTGEGKVIFTQERIGYEGQVFGLHKFATMLENSASMGTGTVTIKNDPRVLPFGKFLRKSKLNELPQLLNIFAGDMSIIGPRPITAHCFSLFPEHLKPKIVTARPGLSGIGSIVFRNEENILGDASDAEGIFENEIMPYKGELEEWYVEHNSLSVYFTCILLSVWVVLTGKGDAIYRVFPTLPPIPEKLEPYILGS